MTPFSGFSTIDYHHDAVAVRDRYGPSSPTTPRSRRISNRRPGYGVASVRPTVKFRCTCSSWRNHTYTKRVTQIRPDGTLVYEANCMKNETVTVDKSDVPQTVDARYLTGVKPGMFVSVIEDVVIAAWAKPGAATPTMVFGVHLK